MKKARLNTRVWRKANVLASVIGVTNLRYVIGMSVFVAIAPVMVQASAQAAQLTNWQFDPATQRLEVNVPGGTSPRYFLLGQPARIVLDLPNTSVGNVPEQRTYSGLVRQIRVGQFEPGLTRIVIELSPDAVLAPQQVELEQLSADNPSGDRWALRPVFANAQQPPPPPIEADTPGADDAPGDLLSESPPTATSLPLVLPDNSEDSETAMGEVSNDELTNNELSDDEVSNNEPSTDELTNNEPSDDELSTNELSTDEVSTNELSTNELSTNELSTNELSTNELSTNELSNNELSSNDLSTDELSSNDLSTDELSTDEVSNNELSSNDLSTDELSTDELTNNELSTNELSDDELSTDELSNNELSNNEPSDDELSNNELSPNDLSTDELSTDELTNNEPSTDEPSDDEVSSDELSNIEVVSEPPSVPDNTPSVSDELPRDTQADSLTEDAEPLETSPEETQPRSISTASDLEDLAAELNSSTNLVIAPLPPLEPGATEIPIDETPIIPGSPDLEQSTLANNEAVDSAQRTDNESREPDDASLPMPVAPVAEDEIIESEIAESEITESEITESEIAENEIAENEIIESEIAEDEITESEIAENEIAEDEITESEITESEIIESEITESEIAENEIAEDEITEDEITEDSESSAIILPEPFPVAEVEIPDRALDEDAIAEGTVAERSVISEPEPIAPPSTTAPSELPPASADTDEQPVTVSVPAPEGVSVIPNSEAIATIRDQVIPDESSDRSESTPLLANQVSIARNLITIIDFGEPLLSSRASGDPPDSQSPRADVDEAIVAANSDVLLPSGTQLPLRYPRTSAQVLVSNPPRQEVLLVNQTIRDSAGRVVVPEGSQVLGRFEAAPDGFRFVTQAIRLNNRNIRLIAQSESLSSRLGDAAIALQPNQIVEIRLIEPVSR
ncbi:MAG: AMIN domain-containing protein [Elainellaceae cyanobacterium]